MDQKIAWIFAVALAAGVCLLLWRVMPGYGWAEWDGLHWQMVASDWPVLWRAWPALMVGGLAGFFGAGGLLWWIWDASLEEAIKAEKERLGQKWEAALVDVENRVEDREAFAVRREAVALQAQQAANLALHDAEEAKRRAEQAWLEATTQSEQARQDMEAVRQDAQRRIRNAVCAAERVKRKANISALADGLKSVRDSPPEPPR
jgi:hypothetical protein